MPGGAREQRRVDLQLGHGLEPFAVMALVEQQRLVRGHRQPGIGLDLGFQLARAPAGIAEGQQALRGPPPPAIALRIRCWRSARDPRRPAATASLDQSWVCSTKPRPPSTGPPWNIRMRRCGGTGSSSSWFSSSSKDMPSIGLLRMMPIAPSGEWAQRQITVREARILHARHRHQDLTAEIPFLLAGLGFRFGTCASRHPPRWLRHA